MLSVLSAFPAVYELLAEPTPERTSTPVPEIEQPITFTSPCTVKASLFYTNANNNADHDDDDDDLWWWLWL